MSRRGVGSEATVAGTPEAVPNRKRSSDLLHPVILLLIVGSFLASFWMVDAFSGKASARDVLIGVISPLIIFVVAVVIGWIAQALVRRSRRVFGLTVGIFFVCFTLLCIYNRISRWPVLDDHRSMASPKRPPDSFLLSQPELRASTAFSRASKAFGDQVESAAAEYQAARADFFGAGGIHPTSLMTNAALVKRRALLKTLEEKNAVACNLIRDAGSTFPDLLKIGDCPPEKVAELTQRFQQETIQEVPAESCRIRTRTIDAIAAYLDFMVAHYADISYSNETYVLKSTALVKEFDALRKEILEASQAETVFGGTGE